MIRPAAFGPNPETAASNAFQGRADLSPEEIRAQALAEFDGMVATLRAAGVSVIVVEDTPEPRTPDAVFPNNWVSFHPDGTVILYPLEARSRRLEVRPEILEWLGTTHGVRVETVVDLRAAADPGRYLEGTGSLVLDHVGGVAYAALASRTDGDLVRAFCDRMDYAPETFTARDRDGTVVYHTNVVLCVGTGFVVLCTDAIEADARERVRARLAAGRDVVEIDLDQMHAFAGNVLEVRAADSAVVVCSRRAHASLRADQRRAIERHAPLLPVDLETIETCGGGSARCMLTEVWS